MISRNRVPGWFRGALRVPDFVKSPDCHLSYEYRHSCTNSIVLVHVVAVAVAVVAAAVAVELPK